MNGAGLVRTNDAVEIPDALHIGVQRARIEIALCVTKREAKVSPNGDCRLGLRAAFRAARTQVMKTCTT